MLTIATVNVNGIRAAFRRGMGEWLDTRKPDVLLLQEVRASDEILADHLSPAEWQLAHEESATKGRSGVAIATQPSVGAASRQQCRKIALPAPGTGGASLWPRTRIAS